MMCDTNWCTFCDNAISAYSDSLYCSEDCLRQDALMHHPMLGYDYADLKGFPHDVSPSQQQQQQSMPSIIRRKPSLQHSDFIQSSQKIPSLSPSLSSSISSSLASSTILYQPKPRRVSKDHFMDQLNKAFLCS
ncbi:hypothetical protein INT47_005927 [Mucor saturninus]|uniref:Uncharacterized protein n=1 Tax=Mucor saturninus TaxID=64648 RepID=A0A8H7V4U7_9FUNG|nr:hypothetical protein INT47_005927 [Mucor saturninus]